MVEVAAYRYSSSSGVALEKETDVVGELISGRSRSDSKSYS